jgi:hypothetical protein
METIKKILDSLEKILRERKGSVLLLICGCIFVFGACFRVHDITKLEDLTPRSSISWPQFAVGVGLALAAVLWFRFVESGWGIPSRDRYIRECTKQARVSTRSIVTCVHTLAPVTESGALSALQDALTGKTVLPGGVKLLAPIGMERVAASLQLHNRGISVRHLGLLQSLDMGSFSVFDSVRSVLSTESSKLKQTDAAMSVESNNIAGMLTALFADLWSRFDAMPCAEFLRFTAEQILISGLEQNLSFDTLAAQLGVGPGELKEFLPVFDRHDTDIFIIIGRPCSGKTTVATAIRDALGQHGIPRGEVYDFNDYEALYERFREDTDQRVFTPAKRGGGFSVRDFTILDTVLRQASFRLGPAARFHRACIVEFARKDYMRALSYFDQSILERSIVVHVQCSLNTCLERNRKRPDLSSDHRRGYVPEDILEGFYAEENMDCVQGLLKREIIPINTDNVPLEQLQTEIQNKLSLGARR